MDYASQDYTSLRNELVNGTVSCEQLTGFFLERSRKNSHLNCFISLYEDRALERAAAVEQKLRSGNPGRLAGMVLAVKDILALRGQRVSCGSRMLSQFNSPYDATAIERIETEDAIVIGKTNMDEFAMGSSNETSFFGPVRNPHDAERVPGGSSGGSAAAVAAGLCSAALGSDTGGSIRQPAAFCGVVGLKPTYGRVSRYGLVAYASSLDQVGPICRSVADSALLLTVLSGHDDRDSTSADRPVPDYVAAVSDGVAGLRFGLPLEYFDAGLDRGVEKAVRNAVEILRDNGAEIIELSLPHTPYAIAAYYIIATAEASSNLARYDGARYGYRAPETKDLSDMYVLSRSRGFGEEVKRRIMLGTFVLSSGYYQAYYQKAQKVRTLILGDFKEAFSRVDGLLTPTSPTTAFKLGEKLDDPLTMYLSDIYTVSANLAGLPAISIPAGRDDAGLPIGLQIIGDAFGETTLLRGAAVIESALQQRANQSG